MSIPNSRPVIETTRHNIAQVPYLGPIPVPSFEFRRVVQGVFVLAAAVAAGRAALLAVAAASERSKIDGGDLAGLRDQVLAHDRWVTATWIAGLAATLIAFGCDLWWRRLRRPRTTVRQHGEAYVEAALNAVAPTWLRVTTIGGACLAAMISRTAGAQTLFDIPAMRMRGAAGALLWAGAIALYVYWVEIAVRATETRIAWSAPHRTDYLQVPFFTPLSEQAAHDIGESSGIGWIFRTAGLVMAGLVASLILVGSFSAGTWGVAWFVGSAAVLVLVGRATWRRFKTARELGGIQPPRRLIFSSLGRVRRRPS